MSLIDDFFSWLMQPFKILANLEPARSDKETSLGGWLSPASHGYLEILDAIEASGDNLNWREYIEEWDYFYKLEPSFYGICGMKKEVVKMQTVRVDFIGIDSDFKEVHDLRRLCIPENYKRVE